MAVPGQKVLQPVATGPSQEGEAMVEKDAGLILGATLQKICPAGGLQKRQSAVGGSPWYKVWASLDW